MDRQHIVWDWNGTLLDDLSIVIESLNVGLDRLGVSPIGEGEYRNHFTRPVRAFYDSLLGRPVTDPEWLDLNTTFHDEYFARTEQASLTVDAIAAISLVEELGWSQSLLSMSPHDELVQVVASHGIADRFVAIDGLREETGGLKAKQLSMHVAGASLNAASVVVVGDTPDDAVAARHIGARVVLYDGGSHHLPALRAMKTPVAYTLVEAVKISDRLSRGEYFGVCV